LPGELFGYRDAVIAKLGLVGAVAVAWLLTFVVMGGHVMPAISSHDATSTSTPTSDVGAHQAAGTNLPQATPNALSSVPTGTSASGSPSATDSSAGPAAVSAETVARAPAVAGLTLVNRPGPRRSAPPVATFRMATFNVLGSTHTRRGTNRKQKASGATRTARAGHYVLDNDIDLVGFQEMQADQRSAFMNATGGRYALYPGNQLRSLDGENSIAYRLATWELVKADSVPIPYFGGHPRNMPVLLLKNKDTGITAYFTNFHNPADTAEFGKQARWRAAAKAREVTLFGALRKTGYPVFVTGDMNERQSWFCSVAGPGDLKAAAGGEGGRDGCSVAGGFRIDWIAGSHDVIFSNYRQDSSSLVSWMTDHPVMITDVSIDSVAFPKSVLTSATAP
jgi:hypothetical protein